MADLPDPSTLSDEELDKVISGEEPEQPEAPETPEAPEEPEQPEEPETPEEPEEPEQPEEEETPESQPKPPSRREQLRIQSLLEKYGEKPAQPKTPAVNPSAALKYEDELDADPEVLKRLTDDRNSYGKQLYEEGLKQANNIEWRTLLQVDTPAVQASHPQLNPKDKTNFHPGVNNAINSFYLAMAGYDQENGTAQNTNVRYADFVDSIYELADEIASTKVVNAQKNVARQAKQTGLRPDGSQAKKLNLNKDAALMTDEELDAKMKALGL